MHADTRQRPGRENRDATSQTGQDLKLASSLDRPADLDLDWIAEPAERTLTALLMELRPSLPPTIAWSLIREAVDGAMPAVLDAAWERSRQQLYPETLYVAHVAWCRSRTCRVRRPSTARGVS